MQQNQYLFVTGLSSKPDILLRNHSFLNSSQQNGYQDQQTKKRQIDFVSKNKIIIKSQKKPQGDSNIYKQQNQNYNIIQKSKSNRLNQSVGFNDDSKEYNSQIMKISQSFDFKLMKAKNILRRIVPNNQLPPRSHSSMSRSVDEQCENQTKFRKIFHKYEQDKENHNYDQYEDKQNFQKISIQLGNQKQNKLNYEVEHKSSSPQNSIEICSDLQIINGGQFDNSDNQDDSKNDSGNNSLLNILREQSKKRNIQQKKNSPEKNQLVLSINDISSGKNLNQDCCSDEEKKLNKSLTEDQKMKYQKIRNIINQDQEISQIQTSDISLKPHQNQKTNRILKKQPASQNNSINIYNKQQNAKNSQNVITNTQPNQKQEEILSSQNILKSIDNDQLQNTFSYSTITLNQKSTIDETLPAQNNQNSINKTNESIQNTIYSDTLFTNNLDRTVNKRKDLNLTTQDIYDKRQQLNTQDYSENQQQIQNNHDNYSQSCNSSINKSNQQPQLLQFQQLNQNQIKISNQIQLINNQHSQIQKQPYLQQSNQYQDQNSNQVQQQQQHSQQQKIENINVNTQKPQKRIINRNYDYELGIKNFPQMNGQLQIQSQISSQSPSKVNKYAQLDNVEDRSNQSISSSSNGQNKQNITLFYNHKKNDLSGFQPSNNTKSPYQQNQKIIIHSQVGKKFNFHDNQQLNNMNSNQDQTSFIDNMNTNGGRVKTEPSLSSENTFKDNYMSHYIQKKNNIEVEQVNQSQQNPNIHNFLEDFNLDNISLKPNFPQTNSSSQSKYFPNQNYLNIHSGTTSKNQQNKKQSNQQNSRTQSSFQFSQINQNQKFNIQSYQSSQYTPSQIKSASSMGFYEKNSREQHENKHNSTHYNIISNPPIISLAQTLDNFSNGFNSSKNSHMTVYGNTIPIESLAQTRKSGGTGGQNMIYEFHEVQKQPNNQRSVSQQSNHSQNIQMNFNISERSQGNNHLYQQNQNNNYQFQNLQPTSLIIAPPSCSSSQSQTTYSTRQFNQKMNKLNYTIGVQNNKSILTGNNQFIVKKGIYTEIDEDTRIFDFSDLKIQEMKQQNSLQKSTLLSDSSIFEFTNTSFTSHNQYPQNLSTDLKANNEIANQFFNKFENTNQPQEINQVANQYLDVLRTRISQIKNQKKSTEIDLILLNSKFIQSIESSNTELKSKLPKNLNQQFENIYQQIKKNIFIYSCQ